MEISELEKYINNLLDKYPLSNQQISMMYLILDSFKPTSNEDITEQDFNDCLKALSMVIGDQLSFEVEL